MIETIKAKHKKVDNCKRKWKQVVLLLHLILCLGLSLGSVASCKFAKAKVKVKNNVLQGASASATLNYGLFTFSDEYDISAFGITVNTDDYDGYNGNDDYYDGGTCYNYKDKSHTNKDLRETTTIQYVAQSLGLLSVFMLIASIVMVSILKCHDFSKSMIHWIQFVLIIAFASSVALLVLVTREGFLKVFKEEKKIIPGSSLDITLNTGVSAYCTAVIIFICLLCTCCLSCSKPSETDEDIDLKVEVVVKVEPQIHVPDEEAEIHIPKEDEPEVYVA